MGAAGPSPQPRHTLPPALHKSLGHGRVLEVSCKGASFALLLLVLSRHGPLHTIVSLGQLSMSVAQGEAENCVKTSPLF
jgi:hypothetical protein